MAMKTLRFNLVEFIPGLFFLGFLVLSVQYNYVLFHTLAELINIIISFSIFVIYWNTRRFLKHDFFLYIAFSIFFVNVFDLAHTLSYKGLVLFVDSDANLATQLWIIARYFQASSFFLATILAHRRLVRWWLVIGAYALITGVLLSVVFVWPVFPECYIDGVGMTTFKIMSEYIISTIFILTMVMFYRMRERIERRVFWLFFGALSLFSIAEIIFTLYIDVYGYFNMLGHLIRIISYFLVYKALIQMGLQDPYESLFRNQLNHKAELRLSEEKYRTLVENVNEVIFSLDEVGRITYISPVVEIMLGYQVDEVIGVYFYETAYPDDHAHLIHNIEHVMEGKKTTFECRLVSDKGKLRWIQVSCRPFIEDNRVVGIRGMLTDITEQRIAEEMLRIKNNAVEAAFTGIAVIELDGKISYANPAFASIFGYASSHNLIERQINDLVNDYQVSSQVNEGLRKDGHWVGELVCHQKNGSPFDVELFASLVRDDEGNPLCYVGSFLNITERKRTEKWRYLYAQLLSLLLEMSQKASVLSEREITQRAVDAAALITSSELGYLFFVDAVEQEMHLSSWTEGFMETYTAEKQDHEPFEKAGVWADSIRQRQPVIHNSFSDLVGKNHDPEGQIEVNRLMSVPIYDDSQITIILGVGNKQTDYVQDDVLQLQLIGNQVAKIIHRQRAEEELKTSLREKVVLLQEIHHRVKNNLQVVSSLLDMQAMKTKAPQMKEALHESRNRVRAMAFVHDRLYRSEDLAVITAANYIPNLVNYLFGVYTKTSSDIKLQLHIEDVAFNLDVAVPCGLIINELVSNALKHAFDTTAITSNSQDENEIRVYVGVQERGHFTIIISDNGVGLPANVDIGQTPSLGLQLVGLLTLQIGGKIDLDRTNGTAYTITAPL